jgi:hypothetical protein
LRFDNKIDNNTKKKLMRIGREAPEKKEKENKKEKLEQ